METCQRNSWIAGGLAGVGLMIYLNAVHEYGWFGAVIWGVVVGVVVAIILLFVLCSGSRNEPPAEIKPVRTLEPAAKSAPSPAADQAANTAAEPEPPVAAAPSDDGVSKPETLAAPRGGVADNLKKIKGVGPKLEKQLNGLGFYHFAQIAAWSDAEIGWVDENLGGFAGRVRRDDWVGQAKTLAQGGGTEFSAKVDKGGVY